MNIGVFPRSVTQRSVTEERRASVCFYKWRDTLLHIQYTTYAVVVRT